MERRKELVQYLIEHGGKPHTMFWHDLANMFNIGEGLTTEQRADRARKYWQWFNNNGGPGVFVPSDVIPIKRDEPVATTRVPDHPYDNLLLRRTWEAQSKDGVIRLHSYENNITGKDLEEYENRLIDRLRSVISEKTVLKQSSNTVIRDNQLGLFIYTADKHIGADFPEHAMYYSEYNPRVVYDRMQKLIDRIQEEYDRNGVFETLFIADLGDGLDGMNGGTTRGGHGLEQNLDNYEQFDTYFKVHKDFFDTIVGMEIAENICFYGMSNANHDGLGFGYSAMRAVEIYLNTAYPFVKTNVNRKFVDHIKYGNHNIIFCHGKDEKYMPKGFPKILDGKTEAFINNYMDYNRIGMTGHISNDSRYNHFIKGDLHQSATEYAKRFRYRNASSFMGASPYITANFGSNFAAVDYDIISKVSDVVYESRLFLQ
jgi:hypothetical protein